MEKARRIIKNRFVILGGGLLLGALIVLGIRFITYAPEHTHYHANFAVYLNGTRDEFKGSQYYQEVAICSAGRGITIPQQRAHMHENINSVIHIHDHAVTWGQFFTNLGWSIGTDFIETDDSTLYREDDTNKLHIVINGQDYSGQINLANTVIKDTDRLLLTYGTEDDATLQTEYKHVASSAAKYDASKDPASCAGNEKVTAKDRFKHLF